MECPVYNKMFEILVAIFLALITFIKKPKIYTHSDDTKRTIIYFFVGVIDEYYCAAIRTYRFELNPKYMFSLCAWETLDL